MAACLQQMAFAQSSGTENFADTIAGKVLADSVTDSDGDLKSAIKQLRKRIKKRIDDKLNEPYDTTRDDGYWFRAMKHGKVNFKDSTMGYPKFVKFCYKVYMWGDRTFNSYDSAYVVSTGKNWKLILNNNYWIDSYAGRPTSNSKFLMNSRLTANLGLSLSFMAVSVGYNASLSNIIHGEKLSNKLSFSFTCARFTADAFFTENRNETSIIYKVDGESDDHKISHFKGVKRKTYGVTSYYFFNSRRYAQAAAYCFSKYQKRSAGSLLAGFSIQHHDMDIDKEKMPQDLRERMEQNSSIPRYLFNDYCLLVGYGHNWVLGRKWLLNLTVAPYMGYRHVMATEAGDKASLFSMNMLGRLGLVFNHKQFFFSFQNRVDAHLYKSQKHRLVNSIIEFTLLGGIRF